MYDYHDENISKHKFNYKDVIHMQFSDECMYGSLINFKYIFEMVGCQNQ